MIERYDFIAENVILSIILLSGFTAISIALYGAMQVAGARLKGKAAGGLAYGVIKASRNCMALFIVTLGVFLAAMTSPIPEPLWDALSKGWVVLSVLLGARLTSNIVGAIANWYMRVVASRTVTQADNKMVPILRRIALVLVYGIAGLIALDALGVPISPLLGGLGITGLAVALALQPTLSNFFAGTYVLTDTAIHPGDYVELQGGPAGYVIDIGWRSTKIRTWLNNLVIIPNSVVADSIVTNYQGPDPAINILVACGVSYESDLVKVEQIALEVADTVLREVPAAVKDVKPFFGYEKFGDSNIEFWIFIQAQDRIGSFVVTSELIKRVHERFRAEEIEINYPVRRVIYEPRMGGSVD